jgi:acyl carrier protein
VTVLPVSWPKFLQAFHKREVPALFETFAQAGGPSTQVKRKESDGADLKHRLVASPESDRQEVLISFVTSQVAKVMGVKSSEVLDIKTPFNSLGLDSLMAVELRNAIADAVGHSFPASLIYDYPTIKALSGHLFHELLAGEVSVSMKENSREAVIPKESVTAEIDGLSLEEMAQLLAVKIKSLNQGNSE